MERFLRFVHYYANRWLGATRRFTAIYKKNIWADDESVSGKGSRNDSLSVKESLEALDYVFSNYEINSLLDLPCGDLNWIIKFIKARPNLDYTGCDIVEELIATNSKKYPDLKLLRLDIIKNVPAKADLVFCKDLINHLTYKEIFSSLSNLAKSGSKFLLITSNSGCTNTELPRWRMATSRPIDLQSAPFFFPAPEWKSNYLSLWRLEAIASVLEA